MTPASLLLLAAATAAALARPVAASADVGQASAEPADAPPLLASDPCDELEALAEEPACEGRALCGARPRAALACSLRGAMEERYVFFSVKSRLLRGEGTVAFDARARLDACVAEERSIAREEDALRFYDRMRRCTSAFEDGHLILSAPVRLPQVSLGLGLRLAGGGRVLVANREARLASTVAVGGARPAEALLAVGDEVVAIDGRPVAEVLADLARHVPGSSEGARLERAVDALTRRDFRHPDRRTARLTVAGPDGVRREVELPWLASAGAEKSPAAAAWLRRTGIPATGGPRREPGREIAEGEPPGARGALRTDPVLPAAEAAGLREYRDDGDRVAVRLGEVVRPERAFCYLQILTFHTESLAAGDGRQPFAAVLEGFLRGCKTRDRDLVLDLRQNEGGYLSHSSALAAMLAPRGGAAPGGALVLRANGTNELVYQQRAPAGVGGGTVPRADDALDPARIAEAIAAARRDGRPFSPAFLEAPLASTALGGYDGKVVALVSPACMSACDRLAAMLKRGGRATLIGGPTEGAGGSQQEARNLGARWTDEENLLSVSIPNAAMGVQRAPAPGGRSGVGAAEEFFDALALENRPVEPHVVHVTTREDLLSGGAGWLAATEAALGAR